MLYAALAAFIIFFIVTLKNPLLSLAGLAALLPSYLLRFEVFGLPSTILEAIIWAIIFSWLIFHRDFSLLKKRLPAIAWPLGLFLAASIISVFITPEFIKSLGLWRAYFLESILMFLLVLAIVKDKKDFEKIIIGLSVAALFLSAFAIGQKFFSLPIPAPWQTQLRATSIFPYPNALGLFLAPTVILMLGQLVKNLSEKKKNILRIAYWALGIILSIASVIFAESDGAVIAIFASGAIFLFLYMITNKKLRSAGIAAFVIIAIAAIILFSSVAPLKNKVLLRDWSGFVRLTIWQESWNMLKDNPILGAGLGGYQAKILPYHESRNWMEVYLFPHNFIFNFWSELGILGLAAFIWLLERFGRLCYKLLVSERQLKIFVITAICALSAIIIHGLVDVPYFKNDLSILFWIVYAMPIVVIPDRAIENIRESN
ncbi:MAG: O-antigen ligase family protein [Patescibacteria group bacterium]